MPDEQQQPEADDAEVVLKPPQPWTWHFAHPTQAPNLMCMRADTVVGPIDLWFDVAGAQRFIKQFEEARNKMTNIVVANPEQVRQINWPPNGHTPN